MIKIFIFLLVAYAMVNLLVYFIQEKMLFFPDEQAFNECREMQRLGAKAETVEVEGEIIRYYSKEVKGAKAQLILFHGNAGAACHRSNYIQNLAHHPINLILAEYPGYSADPRKTNQKIILRNMEKIVLHLQGNHLPFIFFGESLGSSIATYLASKFPTKALILHTPYTSIGDLARAHYPYLLIKLLIRNDFPAKVWAKDVASPTLILHGDQDSTIPIRFAKAQAKNFTQAPQFETFPGRGHNDLNYENELYWQFISSFIEGNLNKMSI